MSKNTQDRFRNGASEAAEAGAAYASAAGERLDEAQASIDRAIEGGREEIERAARQSTQMVRDNPVLAVAGAVGVGLLLGLAMRKKG
ncbi:DUF883 family protein [Mameliella sp. CS4]|uniref:hypothetical protein n=1 Tax=Mameliella sp. CS4 TaxID=2862329 RepID=UPI001C5D86C9|nr:hypothetical protein [Mameliella sp. CS4]MBW4983584.1 DUF883 family protein [Mameliella sp. CS4]